MDLSANAAAKSLVACDTGFSGEPVGGMSIFAGTSASSVKFQA
jgi:hypothetical protein